LISVEISKGRLIHNLNEFKKLAPEGQIAPVLKSNAYGHGLIEVARILEENQHKLNPKTSIFAHEKRMPFFVVDSYFEAIALRAKKVKTPILVIGFTRPETIAAARLKDVSFAITSMDILRLFKKIPPESENSELGMISIGALADAIKRPRRIHIKIDTGMRRQGISVDDVSETIEIFKSNTGLVLEGLCSHFSDADNTDESFTEKQILLWNKAVQTFRSAFPNIKYLHLSNTDGHHFYHDIEANISRLGIGLYGISSNVTLNKKLNILPVMEMKTIITGMRKLQAGETVGYSNTFKATKDMKIATIPVGYFEGLDRRLSNQGTILVGTNRIACPIVGRVSMNITVIDVSKLNNVAIGTPVTVISSNPDDPNSIANISKLCGVISYESAIRISTHLKRVIVD